MPLAFTTAYLPFVDFSRRLAFLLDPERVFNDGPHARLGVFDVLGQAIKLAAAKHAMLPWPQRDVPFKLTALVLRTFLNALVTRITKDACFFAMQQMMRLGDIVYVGWRGHQAMHHTHHVPERNRSKRRPNTDKLG